MIKLLKYLDKAAWLMIVFIVGLVILQVYSDLELPGRLTNIITYASTSNALEVQGILTPEMKQEFTDRIINNALQMLGFAVLSMTASIIVGFLAARVAASYSYSLRKAIYRHIQDFSMIEIDRFSTASLITRTTNDITQIQMVVVMVLRMAISAPATAIMGILKASKIQGSSQLSLIVVFAVVALVVLVTTIFLLVMPKFKSIQGFTDKLNLVTRENLTGIRVVRAYGAMEYQEEKFDNVNRPLTKTNVFVNRMMNLMTPGMNIIMHGTSLSILWVGAYWVNENPLNLGNVFGFQQITMFIVMAFMQLIMILSWFQEGWFRPDESTKYCKFNRRFGMPR